MNALMGRLKKAEEALGSIDKGPPLILIAKYGESDEQVYSRLGITPDPNRLEIMIVSFVSPDAGQAQRQEQAEGKAAADVNQEIEQILAELQQQGLSEQEIERLVVEGTGEVSKRHCENAEYQTVKNGCFSTIQKQEYQAVEHTEKAEPQPPPVNRADDVISLFRGRR
jgi:hypothetical protein